MEKISSYCKAYALESLREFDGWASGARTVNRAVGGHAGSGAGESQESNYLYLHDDFTVTSGIFVGENVVYDNITAEWLLFCKERLNFEIPAYAATSAREQGNEDSIHRES